MVSCSVPPTQVIADAKADGATSQQRGSRPVEAHVRSPANGLCHTVTIIPVSIISTDTCSVLLRRCADCRLLPQARDGLSTSSTTGTSAAAGRARHRFLSAAAETGGPRAAIEPR